MKPKTEHYCNHSGTRVSGFVCYDVGSQLKAANAKHVRAVKHIVSGAL